MRLIDRLAGRGATEDKERGQFGSFGWPDSGFTFGGVGYGPFGGLNTTMGGGKTEAIANDFGGYLQALRQSPPAFAAQMKRARYLSQARFTWRNTVTGKLFGTSALQLVENPWPSGTTGELLTKMEWDEGLTGNAYVYLRPTRQGPQLKVLRPDWVTIVLGSEQDAAQAADQLDAEVVGYVYTPGGLGRGGKPVTLLPQDIAHWSPLPDPAASFRGMSWITPLVREIQGDIAVSEHKLRFFENGATPNLVVKGIPAASSDEFKRLVQLMDEEHSGVSNAYKTLYLAAGADATVVGANLQQIAFKEVQGAGETRIAAVGEVPASLLGISEGMQGSSLNAGNYKEAKRSFIDGWFSSTLQSVASCLNTIVPSPTDAELALDPSRMPLLREDATDASTIREQDARTLKFLLEAGYDPDAATTFVQTGDIAALLGNHSGLFSIQLQPPGEQGEPGPTTTPTPAPEGAPNAAS